MIHLEMALKCNEALGSFLRWNPVLCFVFVDDFSPVLGPKPFTNFFLQKSLPAIMTVLLARSLACVSD